MIRIASGQRGISLVEIMVALMLSLFLMGGVLQIYLSSKQTYRSQEGYSRLQENGRFALEMLSRQIRAAGYKTLAWDQAVTAFPAASPFTSNGQVIVGTEGGTTPSPHLPDSISIRLQGNADGLMQDCLGSTLPPPPAPSASPAPSPSGSPLPTPSATPTPAPYTTIQFRIDTAARLLECSTTRNGTTQTQPLIDGVENMQVLYGIDTDGDAYANKYRNANQVTAEEWNSVVSARVGLLLNTLQNVSTDGDTATFNLLGTTIPAPAGTATNRFMRRHPFTATITLRNRIP